VAKAKKKAAKPSADGGIKLADCTVGDWVECGGDRMRVTAINAGYCILRSSDSVMPVSFASPDEIVYNREPYEVRHLTDGKGAKT
jgi:hypothetical protein